MSSMYDTRDFRRGLKVLMNNDPWIIVDFQHVSPGKGAAFTRTKVKNLRTGQVVEHNIKSGDKLEKPDVEERNMQFLYNDADGYHFMDTGNYEQISLTNLEVGDTKNYLIENSIIKVVFFNSKPIGVETETFVELKVVETSPGVRGDTATGGSKPAKLETGLVVSVPFHINEGDILRIDTREAVYVDRVNRK
ncbi:elongation factor P [Silvanigrella paludirubra]|jgi:elongation factor P|uniref:Elongation factor P n=2 Tax=Silvanigrellaceae TaxID=2024974 RepID=A0A6N6VZP1_9BACT|nr:elongation factor P [Silvanigrella paludirubra]KAB8040742.1 elongation factor P [Silvanigrella paludirubra]